MYVGYPPKECLGNNIRKYIYVTDA